MAFCALLMAQHEWMKRVKVNMLNTLQSRLRTLLTIFIAYIYSCEIENVKNTKRKQYLGVH